MNDPFDHLFERLRALDEEIANGWAFRALLKDLGGRKVEAFQPQLFAIWMARAAILRALISSVMACLDKKGTDRAGVGQILHVLEPMVAEFDSTAFQRAKDTYEAVVESDAYARGKRLRDEVAHILIRNEPTVPVQYETYYELHDKAQQITIDLFQACDIGRPNFLTQEDALLAGAKTFWDNYIKGMPK